MNVTVMGGRKITYSPKKKTRSRLVGEQRTEKCDSNSISYMVEMIGGILLKEKARISKPELFLGLSLKS